MIEWRSKLKKFGKQGEKTGWTYIEVSAATAAQLQPGTRKSFRVKGTLDDVPLEGVALLPMGDGNFILPVNASMRKAIRKQQGAVVRIGLSADTTEKPLQQELVACLKDEPEAWAFFRELPAGHQRYFSNWVTSARTIPTRVKRIAQAVAALSRKQGFSEMLRAEKEQRTGK